MKKPVQIKLPDIPGAEKMTAMDLNNAKLTMKNTVLTPEILEAPGCDASAPRP